MPSASLSRFARSLLMAGSVLALAPFPAASQGRTTTGSITTIGEPAGGAGVDRASDAPSGAAPKDCSTAYGRSLAAIAGDEFTAVDAARKGNVAGDPGLPGRLMFTPRSAGRGKAEMAALAAANALARSGGRSSGVADADNRWIADRLRVDLADYLGQKPAPYLCSGVADYLATLRGYAERVGSSPRKRQEWVDVQRAATRRSVDAAMAAMAAATALPLPAVPARPAAASGVTGDLRPTSGLSRGDLAPAPAGAPASTGSANPAARPADLALGSPADISAAVDLLLAAVEKGGFADGATGGTTTAAGGEPAAAHPDLARLASARAYVDAKRPLVANAALRFRLATAFADLEALDYLTRAQTSEGDPMATAIFRTLDAIAAAHGRDCTCAPQGRP